MNMDGHTLFALFALAISLSGVGYTVLCARRMRRWARQGIEREWLDGHYEIPAVTFNGRELSQREVGAITAAVYRYAASFERGEFATNPDMDWFRMAVRELRGRFEPAGQAKKVVLADRPD